MINETSKSDDSLLVHSYLDYCIAAVNLLNCYFAMSDTAYAAVPLQAFYSFVIFLIVFNYLTTIASTFEEKYGDRIS